MWCALLYFLFFFISISEMVPTFVILRSASERISLLFPKRNPACFSLLYAGPLFKKDDNVRFFRFWKERSLFASSSKSIVILSSARHSVVIGRERRGRWPMTVVAAVRTRLLPPCPETGHKNVKSNKNDA